MTELRFAVGSGQGCRKHQEAWHRLRGGKSVFADERDKPIADPQHSDNEDRFVLLRLSIKLKLLVVCHCYRSKSNTIRIISARKATAVESRQY